MPLEIRQFPCLSDNYGFLVKDAETGETATIDTPDAAVIIAAAEHAGWPVTQIWNTHHHYDHAGGNADVAARFNAKIVAPASEARRIPDIDTPVREGDVVELGASRARVYETPGHTTGHVVYHFEDDGVAFVGDTLFALGCGRLFEGDPAQMWSSLSKLRAWPDDTVIYCAHEYTQSNARFALSVDPTNEALQSYAAEVEAKRADDKPTVPTILSAELAANPFLRADDPGLQHAMGHDGDVVATFGEIRRRKDVFK